MAQQILRARSARACSQLKILPPGFGRAQHIIGRGAMAETYSNISIWIQVFGVLRACLGARDMRDRWRCTFWCVLTLYHVLYFNFSAVIIYVDTVHRNAAHASSSIQAFGVPRAHLSARGIIMATYVLMRFDTF